jgi:replicative DNA helicase
VTAAVIAMRPAMAQDATPEPGAGLPPPHSPEAEAAVIACCFERPEQAAQLLAVAAPGDFLSRALEETAIAIHALVDAGAAVDLPAVNDRLRDTGRASMVGAGFLAELCERHPVIADPLAHARRVQVDAILRRTQQVLRALLVDSYKPMADVPSFLARVNEQVGACTRTVGAASAVTSLQATTAVARRLVQPRTPGVTTGFLELDAMTQGFEPGGFYVLAGRPGMGKSAAAFQAAHAAASAGYRVLICSLEMRHEQVMARILSAASSVPLEAIRARNLSPAMWSRFTATSAAVARMPITIVDAGSQTLQDMRSAARTHRPALIIVDHIGLVSPAPGSAGARRGRQDEVGEISRGLKALAKELAVPILGLCQVNRDVARAARAPTLADLRDSGSIEQDADAVYTLHRPGYYDPRLPEDQQREVQLTVAKQRDGRTGVVHLDWVGEFARFDEPGRRP